MKLSSSIVHTMTASDSVEQPSSVQDPGVQAQPKRETDREGIVQQREESHGQDRQAGRDLTSQEELSADEAKKLPDSLNLRLRDESKLLTRQRSLVLAESE